MNVFIPKRRGGGVEDIVSDLRPPKRLKLQAGKKAERESDGRGSYNVPISSTGGPVRKCLGTKGLG